MTSEAGRRGLDRQLLEKPTPAVTYDQRAQEQAPATGSLGEGWPTFKQPGGPFLDVRHYGALGKQIVARGTYIAGFGLVVLDDPKLWPTQGHTLADLLPQGGEIAFGLVPIGRPPRPYLCRGNLEVPQAGRALYANGSDGLEAGEHLIPWQDTLPVLVHIDDRLPIQEALDDAAKDPSVAVWIPRGQYVLGVPCPDLAPDVRNPDNPNVPLFLQSGVKVCGDGPGETILRLADNVNQFYPTKDLKGSYVFDTAPGVPWPQQSGIEIRDMTIDGNRDGQKEILNTEGDSALWDYWGYRRATVFAETWDDGTSGFDDALGNVQGMPDPLGYGPQGNANGKAVEVFLTLSNDFGFETSVSRDNWVWFQRTTPEKSKQHAIKVHLPKTKAVPPMPLGAPNPFLGPPTRVNVYFKYLGVNLGDNGPLSYPNGKDIDPGGYHLASFDLMGQATKDGYVSVNDPALLNMPYVDAAPLPIAAVDPLSSALRLHNLADSKFTNLTIENFAGYGIEISEVGYSKTSPVSNLTFTSVELRNNARHCCVVFLDADGIAFNNCVFDGSSWGIDFEGAGHRNDVSFVGCRFTNNTGTALAIGVPECLRLSVKQCWFEANGEHVQFNIDTTQDVTARFEESTFKDSLGYAFSIQHGHDATVSKCVFWTNGFDPLDLNFNFCPFWFSPGQQDPPDWKISDCFFWPSPPVQGPNVRPIFNIDSGSPVEFDSSFIVNHDKDIKSLLRGGGHPKNWFAGATIWDPTDPSFDPSFVSLPVIAPSTTPGKIRLLDPSWNPTGATDPVSWLDDPMRGMLER